MGGCRLPESIPDAWRGRGRRDVSSLVSVDLDEPPQGPVVGPFHIIGKQASRKLSHAPVIRKALAANALPMARLIRAVTVSKVFLFLTFFHDMLRRRVGPYPCRYYPVIWKGHYTKNELFQKLPGNFNRGGKFRDCEGTSIVLY